MSPVSALSLSTLIAVDKVGELTPNSFALVGDVCIGLNYGKDYMFESMTL